MLFIPIQPKDHTRVEFLLYEIFFATIKSLILASKLMCQLKLVWFLLVLFYDSWHLLTPRTWVEKITSTPLAHIYLYFGCFLLGWKLLRHDFWRGLMALRFFPLVLLRYANSGGYKNKTNWQWWRSPIYDYRQQRLNGGANRSAAKDGQVLPHSQQIVTGASMLPCPIAAVI